MSDVSLELNQSSPSYRDFKIVSGDLVLTKDADPSGTDNILQNILQRLAFFAGEWYLDNTLGVPWFQQILVEGVRQGKIDTLLRNEILGTPGVEQLLSYEFKPEPATRRAFISFDALTTSGRVNYSGTISAGGTANP